MAEKGRKQPKRHRKPREPPKDGVRVVPLSSIEPEEVEWFMDPLIPFGMMTLLVGDPGLGKSLLTVKFAQMAGEQGYSSILLSAEDHKAVTIRPRLEAAGADIDLVHTLEVRRDGVEAGLLLPEDGEELEKKVMESGARLVVVDPLSAHLAGNVNSWNDQQVRGALAPLYRLAERHGCAVVVVAHLNKGAGTNGLYRTGGSIGVPASVRSALLLARHPDDADGELGSQRVLAHIKSNVAHQAKSIKCEVVAVPVTGYDKPVPTISLRDETDLVGSELLRTGQGVTTKLDDAKEFLEDILSEGPLPVSEVLEWGKANGHSRSTLNKAKLSLKIDSYGEGKKGKGGGGKGKWLWRLPK